jgi:tRNA(adenine34) deaminase
MTTTRFSPADLRRMGEALRAARDAGRRAEVPVGALIVDASGRRLGIGANRTLRDTDPTAHAEIVALRRAARRAGNYRLTGATLYCTLEPCPMCLGALLHSRVGRLVYAAADPKGGGISLGIFPWKGANHRVEVSGGARAEEAAALLRAFFRARRSGRSDAAAPVAPKAAHLPSRRFRRPGRPQPRASALRGRS